MLPDFLIVGAMKAGTTTLFRDLSFVPQIYIPETKEPWTLVHFAGKANEIRQEYQKLFARARPAQFKGDASTGYTMRPDYEDVAKEALKICGPHLKIIYLEREPVTRIVSQYKHEFANGLTEEPLNLAVRKHDRYVAYSAYDWQIAPWLETFGHAAVLRLSFERYVNNRLLIVQEVLSFLGIKTNNVSAIDIDMALNATDGRRVLVGTPWENFIRSRFYQQTLKPVIPWKWRLRGKNLLLPTGRISDETLMPEVETELRQRLAAWGR